MLFEIKTTNVFIAISIFIMTAINKLSGNRNHKRTLLKDKKQLGPVYRLRLLSITLNQLFTNYITRQIQPIKLRLTLIGDSSTGPKCY